MLTFAASTFPAAGAFVRWRENTADWPAATVEAEVLTYRDHGSFRVCQLRAGRRLISAAVVCEAGRLRIITARSGVEGIERALRDGAAMPADARVFPLSIDTGRRVRR